MHSIFNHSILNHKSSPQHRVLKKKSCRSNKHVFESNFQLQSKLSAGFYPPPSEVLLWGNFHQKRFQIWYKQAWILQACFDVMGASRKRSFRTAGSWEQLKHWSLIRTQSLSPPKRTHACAGVWSKTPADEIHRPESIPSIYPERYPSPKNNLNADRQVERFSAWISTNLGGKSFAMNFSEGAKGYSFVLSLLEFCSFASNFWRESNSFSLE